MTEEDFHYKLQDDGTYMETDKVKYTKVYCHITTGVDGAINNQKIGGLSIIILMISYNLM